MLVGVELGKLTSLVHLKILLPVTRRRQRIVPLIDVAPFLNNGRPTTLTHIAFLLISSKPSRVDTSLEDPHVNPMHNAVRRSIHPHIRSTSWWVYDRPYSTPQRSHAFETQRRVADFGHRVFVAPIYENVHEAFLLLPHRPTVI